MYPERLSESNNRGGVVCVADDGTPKSECSGYDFTKKKASPPHPFLLSRSLYNPTDARQYALPPYIQIPGEPQSVNFWLWGQGYRYGLELHAEDSRGNIHVLPGPTIDWHGWRSVHIKVPHYVHGGRRHIADIPQLRILRFKMVSEPNERPDEFYVYLDGMQAQTNHRSKAAVSGRDLIRHPFWHRNVLPPGTRGAGNE